MRFDIKDYDLGAMVCSAASDIRSAQSIVDRGLNAALIRDDSILFMPRNRAFALSEEAAAKLKCCEDHDVLIIGETGRGYQHFANEKDDNPLLLTQKCNSNCVMCPTPEAVRRREDDIGMDMLIESVRYIPDDARHLTMTGGEPFLAGEKIFALLAEIKDRLPYTECLLLTNARALGYKRYADLLAETAPKNIIVGIPLHGYDAETHDAITRSPGSFEQTVDGIVNLISRGFQVELRIVVSRLNYRYIDKIAELIISRFKKLHSVKIMGLEMTGSASVNADRVWLPYREAFIASRSAILSLVSHGIDVGLYNFPLCAVDESFHLICKKSITDYKIRYAEQCELCSKKPNCGGTFAGSARFAKNDIVPWIIQHDQLLQL